MPWRACGWHRAIGLLSVGVVQPAAERPGLLAAALPGLVRLPASQLSNPARIFMGDGASYFLRVLPWRLSASWAPAKGSTTVKPAVPPAILRCRGACSAVIMARLNVRAHSPLLTPTRPIFSTTGLPCGPLQPSAATFVLIYASTQLAGRPWPLVVWPIVEMRFPLAWQIRPRPVADRGLGCAPAQNAWLAGVSERSMLR